MGRMRPPGSRPTERVLRRLATAGLLLAASCRSSSGPGPSLGEDCTASPASVVTVPVPAPAERFRVLVFTRTLGFRHASIPVAIEAARALGSATGFAVDATEDAARFTDAGLAPYAVVVFLSTTGDVLDATQQGAMERWLAAGHGWVGVHAAADTEYEWAWYQSMLGAHFVGHSAVQQATVVVSDTANASTRRLAPTLSRVDEWYDFAAQPAAGARMLVRVDESTYSGGHMGGTHPLSWLQSYGGGRAWYTAMGHTSCAWTERPFLEHVRGGILWAAGMDTLGVQPL
jgi:cytochrome c